MPQDGTSSITVVSGPAGSDRLNTAPFGSWTMNVTASDAAPLGPSTVT